MPCSRLGLGLGLSLLIHLALLATPATLVSPGSPPWESALAPVDIEARLRPAARPGPLPRRPPREQEPRQMSAGRPAPAQDALLLPAQDDSLSPPPSPPGATASPSAEAPDEAPSGAVAAPAPPAPPGLSLPRAGRIRFAVNRGDQGFVIGRAVHRWRHDDARYEISSVTETTGLAALFRPVTMVQSSAGDVVGSTLKPREYRSERDGKLVDAASFDWAGLRLSYGGGRTTPLLAGSQDMLSAFYQLGRQGLDAGAELALTTGKKYESYRFVVLGEETLALSLGEVRTIHLKSGGEPGRDATEVWLAPALHGLPLKIRYTDRNGDVFDQTAEEIEFDQSTGNGKP